MIGCLDWKVTVKTYLPVLGGIGMISTVCTMGIFTYKATLFTGRLTSVGEAVGEKLDTIAANGAKTPVGLAVIGPFTIGDMLFKVFIFAAGAKSTVSGIINVYRTIIVMRFCRRDSCCLFCITHGADFSCLAGFVTGWFFKGLCNCPTVALCYSLVAFRTGPGVSVGTGLGPCAIAVGTGFLDAGLTVI